jgi:hypothetical protein
MLIILIVILSLLIIGLIYTNKEHFAVRSSGVNSCGELTDGPFSKAVNTPSCFFYDINRNNENIYSSLNYVSNKIGEELDITQNINNNLIIKSKEANEQIQTLMNSPVVAKVKSDLEGNQADLQNNTIYIDLNTILEYYKMPSEIENQIIDKLTTVINKKIEELTNYSGVNISNQVRQHLTEERLREIITEISIILNNKFEARGNIDIIETINQVINGLNINQEIKNKIKLNIMGDKQINAYLKGSSKNEISIDDMVYYRHELISDFPNLGKSGEEIIVGGLVCSSADSDSRNISVRAIYFINPNKVVNVEVDGPAKYKQIYIKANPQKQNDLDAQCYGMPNRDLACRPNLWLEDQEEFAKKNLGNYTKGEVNEVQCQNTPEVYKNLPKYVPIASVTKNLNKLLLKCQTDELKASEKLANSMEGKAQCTERCLNIVSDNNNSSRFLERVVKNIKTKFSFKNNEIITENEGNQPSKISLPDNDKPRYLFQRGNTVVQKSQMFVYSQSKKWYELSQGKFQEIYSSPDQNNCCVPV